MIKTVSIATIRSVTFAAGASLLLTGCFFSRSAQPVAAYQTYDSQMTCSQIEEAIEQNESDVSIRVSEMEANHNDNPFSMSDLLMPFYEPIGAERVEISSYVDRQIHLERMARAKNCGFVRFIGTPAYPSAGPNENPELFVDFTMKAPGHDFRHGK